MRALLLVLVLPFSCGERPDPHLAPNGGGDARRETDGGADSGLEPDGGARPAWNAFLGAHYQPRTWARGGLREPGGAAGYEPAVDGGVIIDRGLDVFRLKTLPALNELLRQGQSAVLLVGGAQDSEFFGLIETPVGREAFADALRTRIAGIDALHHAGWERRVVFQFGNEIQNQERFYGAVCRGGGAPTDQCDLATVFAPTYVERYLAPGVETLRAESQRLFGRPDALRVALGSVVNLVARQSFVEALLSRTVEGRLAPTLQGQKVSSFVDTVTIHYTMPSPDAVAALDAFADRWMNPDAGSVRALWMTEEVGVTAAKGGDGLASALRAYAPALAWWSKRGLTPETGHLFIWGADVRCSPNAGLGCASIDDAMPYLADFLGDEALVAAEAIVTSSQPLTTWAYRVGAHKHLVLVWAPTRTAASVSAVSLSGVEVSAVEVLLIGSTPRTLPATVRGETLEFQAALSDRDVLALLITSP